MLNHLHARGPVIMLIAVYAPACVLCETHRQVVPAKCFFIARRWMGVFVSICNNNKECSPLRSIGMVLTVF